MGTRFIPTTESMADEEYKKMIVRAERGPPPSFLPTVYTDKISGIHANFMRESLEKSGLDPDNLDNHELGAESFEASELQPQEKDEKKAWRDVWSAGHGVMNIHEISSVKDVVSKLKEEYEAARKSLLGSKI